MFVNQRLLRLASEDQYNALHKEYFILLHKGNSTVFYCRKYFQTELVYLVIKLCNVFWRAEFFNVLNYYNFLDYLRAKSDDVGAEGPLEDRLLCKYEIYL